MQLLLNENTAYDSKFWKHMLPRPSITQSALTPTAGLRTSQEGSHNSCQRQRT